MTFTYNLVTPNDITRVRAAIGDTVEASAMFSDEEIAFYIAENAGWQAATIALVQTLIAKVASTPDFKADWLEVDASKALAGYEALLSELRRRFGMSQAPSVRVTAVQTYRRDSLQKGDGGA